MFFDFILFVGHHFMRWFLSFQINSFNISISSNAIYFLLFTSFDVQSAEQTNLSRNIFREYIGPEKKFRSLQNQWLREREYTVSLTIPLKYIITSTKKEKDKVKLCRRTFFFHFVFRTNASSSLFFFFWIFTWGHNG